MSLARGAHWERKAESWLRRQKAKILDRNYRCRTGEIDLVIRDGKAVAFVEIKYRSRQDFGSGADQVTYSKQRRIVSAARHYLQYHKHAQCQIFRFDVVSINDSSKGAEIQWIKSAFEVV